MADPEYIVSKSIPDELQCLIKKATAYDPDDRYDSMSEFCDEIGLVCQTSESYELFRVSDYYEDEIAYTILIPGESEADRSIAWDDISDTAILYQHSLDYTDEIHSRKEALAKDLRKCEPVLIEEKESSSFGSVTSPAWQESDDATQDAKVVGGNGIWAPIGKLASGLCFCRACGASCNINDKSCAYCGSRLGDLNSTQSMPMMQHSAMPGRADDSLLGDDERGNINASVNEGITGVPYNRPPVSFSYAGETTVLSDHAPLEISKVHFSAIASRTLIKGDYTIINIVMY